MNNNIPIGYIYAGPYMYSHWPEHKPWPIEECLLWDGIQWITYDSLKWRDILSEHSLRSLEVNPPTPYTTLD